jgi:hypothetical protein
MTYALLLAIVALTLICEVAGAAFAVLGLPVSLRYADWGFPGFNGAIGLAAVALGWLIARRHARNPIGWLLLAIGLLSAAQLAGHYYSVLATRAAPASLPAPSVGAWLEGWVWVPTVGSAAILLPLVFPTGSVLSPRWRPVARLGLVAIAIASAGYLAQPRLRTAGEPANPVVSGVSAGAAGMLIGLGMLLFTAAMLAASASLVVRFRRSRGVERQQLKWLALAVSVAATTFATYIVALASGAPVNNPLAALAAISFVGVVGAIGIAILRHRLFDIDLLINRALVYASVTVVLAAVYVSAVLVLQELLASLTDQRGLVVAASTLLVAALFAPVRRRMQAAVDRRFYRSRYDAEQVIGAFAVTLRDKVELAGLTDELVSVVEQSIRPSRVRVWLRDRREAAR